MVRRDSTLKTRMYALLLASSVIPLLLTWLFVNCFVFKAHERQLDLMIRTEVEKTGSGITELMDSMKYMSQQIVSDQELITRIRLYMSGNHSELQYINERLAVFEGSNPQVANITLFSHAAGDYVRINNSLIRGGLPAETLRFSTQGILKFYGPYTTSSVVDTYPVISLVRAVPQADMNPVYVYIESGFKLLDIAPSQSLDMLNAVFLITDATGETVYAGERTINPSAQKYRRYRYAANRTWSLWAYIPEVFFKRQTFALSFGFLISAVAAAGSSVMLFGFLWRSVWKPLTLFEENLKTVILEDDTAPLRAIRVRELDQNFEYFEKLKNRIRELLAEVRQDEKDTAELEMKLLMFKINPHFIHNTINTLKWFAAGHGYRDIENFLSSLNRLLLYNMEKNGETTVQSELDSIRDYIALQQIKYEITCSFRIDVPAPLLQSRTPRFILYPLVENAILHGLKGKGAIEIRIGTGTAGRISVKVIDSGPPLHRAELERILNSIKPHESGSNSTSIGLRYVNRVLQAMFPGESFFRISQEGEMNATVVEIEMPYCVGT